MNYIRLMIFSVLTLLVPIGVFAQQQTPVSNAFKISVDNITTTQARVLVTSTAQFTLQGDIAVTKTGGTNPTYCHNIEFQSAIQVICIARSLSQGSTYTISVTATDATNRQYTGTGEFQTQGTAPTGTSNPGNTTTQTSNQTSQSNTSTSVYIPPANPLATTSSGTNPAVSNFQLQVRLNNPLKVDTIEGAVKFFVTTLVKIAIPFIVVFFIWAGLKFILALGKPEEVAKAKKMFLPLL